jgi:hypothetical protein
MPTLDPRKRKQAYRLRLQRISIAEVSRRLHMAPATIRKLEHGWVDKKGVRHRGWGEEIERLWDEDRKSEIECGLALREEQVRVLKRIAQQAIEKVEDQFSTITMKTTTDWKTLVSEIRELIRMLSEQVGHKRGEVRTTTLRTEISLEEVREAYAEAHVVDAEDVHDVAEAGLVELAPPGVPGPGEHIPEETESEENDQEGTDA